MNMISGNGLMAFAPPLPPPPETSCIAFQGQGGGGGETSFLPHHHSEQDGGINLMSPLLMRRSVSFSGAGDRPWDYRDPHQNQDGVVGGEDEMSDDGSSHLGEKKRRLSMEQVKALEKSFELGNKLEPERKMQLARALGLQPRQIAIWFQNRRARSKTKQLEKDYEVLKRQFQALSADNDALKSQNKKLHSQLQLMALRSRESNEGGPTMIINLNRETEASWNNNTSENNSNNNNNKSNNNNNNIIDVNLAGSCTPHSSISPTNLTDLLKLDHHQDVIHHHHNNDHNNNEGSYCNMFVGSAIDEQAAEFLAMAPSTTTPTATTFPLNFSFS